MAKSFNLAAIHYHEKPQRLDSDALHQWGLSGFQTKEQYLRVGGSKGIPNSKKAWKSPECWVLRGDFD